MAYTQTDLDKLEKALASGVQQIRNANGELITFRSLDEIREAIRIARGELYPLNRRRRVVYPCYRRNPWDQG